MVSENARVRGKIPELFVTLMGPHVEKVDEVISPGLTLLRWTSLNIGSFEDSVYKALEELELLVDRVTNILELRIEGVLQDIQTTPLCELPDNDPWTVHQFVSKTQVRINSVVGYMCTLTLGSSSHYKFPVLYCMISDVYLYCRPCVRESLLS